MLILRAVGKDRVLPIRDQDIVHHGLGAVVHRLGHARGGSVLIPAEGEHALQGEVLHQVRRNLESQFHAHVPLVDPADGEVREGVLEIVVGAHHLGLVADRRVVRRRPDIDAVAAVLPVQVRGEGFDGLQVGNDGVAGTRGQEDLVELRSLVEIAHIGIDAHRAADHVVQAQFPGVCQELGHLGLAQGGGHGAVRFIGRVDGDSVHDQLVPVGIESREKPFPHQAVPPEGFIAQLAPQVGAEIAEGELAGKPAAEVTDLRIVVIAVFVPHSDLLGSAMLHVVVQVVLELVGLGRKVTLGEIVDIHKMAAAQQVRNDLVILRPVDAGVQAAVQDQVLRRPPLEGRGQVQVPLVHMTLLLDILGTAAFLDRIHLIQTVPVHMGQLGKIGSMGPYLVRPRVLEHVVPVHVRIGVEEVARQVPVVIRTRILRVIPVQGGITVLAEPVQDGGAPLELVGRGEVVLQDGDGFIGLAHTRIADPAVLIAPVGIVHVVPHQVIDLLRRGVLRAALARRGKEDQA